MPDSNPHGGDEPPPVESKQETAEPRGLPPARQPPQHPAEWGLLKHAAEGLVRFLVDHAASRARACRP